MKYTNLSFMFNTNYRPKSDSESYEFAGVLDRAAHSIFDDPENFRKYIRWVKKGTNETEAEGRDEDVKKISIKFAFELGENMRYGGRMHMHGQIKIDHLNYLRLDSKQIERDINAKLTELGAVHLFTYFHWKLDKVTTKQYLRKYDEDEDQDVAQLAKNLEASLELH